MTLCGFAQAQARAPQGAPPLERLVAQDAARFLGHADPVVRGEAALIVAAEGSMHDHGALLALAKDPNDTARLYGIVGAGLLGTPGVSHVLRAHLDNPQARAQHDGVAAAFALGLLPPEQSASLMPDVLAGLLRGSGKRQRDALLALLMPLHERPQPTATAALRRLFDEDLTRDPVVQAHLLRLLLPIDASLRDEDLLRLLRRGSSPERIAVLQFLGEEPRRRGPELDALVTALAESALDAGEDDAGVRAAALAAMARRKLPKALELAVEALGAKDPRELHAAMHLVLSLGGASMRQVLERHVLSTVEPARKAALLSAFGAPPSETLLDDCAGLAADPKADLEVRVAAAFLLERAAPLRAKIALRELFVHANDATVRRRIAAALLRAPGPMTTLTDLLPPGATLRTSPRDWHPLLGAGHPQAERALLDLLAEPAADPGQLAAALRGWRCRVGIGLPPEDARLLPKAIARVLVDGP